MSLHICAELEERRGEGEVHTLISSSYNTDYNKLGERMKEERWITY